MILMLVLLIFTGQTVAAQPVSRFLRTHYKAADGTWVRRDDVPGAFKRALSAGALRYVDPLTKPWGQEVAYVRDLNGYLVELCTQH